MPRLAYVNERAEETVLVLQPWAHSARVSPQGRVDIIFEAIAGQEPEVRVVHRDGEVEIALKAHLVSVSGEGVSGFKADSGPAEG